MHHPTVTFSQRELFGGPVSVGPPADLRICLRSGCVNRAKFADCAELVRSKSREYVLVGSGRKPADLDCQGRSASLFVHLRWF